MGCQPLGVGRRVQAGDGMSLISAILSGARPTLPGVPTIYRPEDYRDKPVVKEPEVLELTEEVKHAISPTSYEHMIGQKLANTSNNFLT